MDFEPYHYDATWYRFLYAEGVQHLLVATADDRDTEYAFGPGAGSLARSFAETAGPPSLDRDQLAQGHAALSQLVSTSAAALDAAGMRWPRRGRLWMPRPGGDSPARDDDRLAAFLDGTVEPSAVIAMLSLRVQAGMPVELPSQPPRVEALDRRSIADGEVDVTWLTAYVRDLLSPAAPGGSAIGWVGARLGLNPRRQRPARPSYRVFYSLACLLSRMRDEDGAELALGKAMRRAPTTERRHRLAEWAWSDPGLAWLRELRTGDFDTLVGYPYPDRTGWTSRGDDPGDGGLR